MSQRSAFDQDCSALMSFALRHLRLSNETLDAHSRLLADALQEQFDRELLQDIRATLDAPAGVAPSSQRAPT